MSSTLTLAFGASLLGIWLYWDKRLVGRRWRQPGLHKAVGPMPQWGRIWRRGAEIETPVQAWQAGDTIVVCSGELIPVAGIITAGAAWVADQPVGGESRKQIKKIHHRVCANHLVLAGSILVQVEPHPTGDDTILSGQTSNRRPVDVAK